MSIKDILARISGPKGYGGPFGRSVSEFGLALGYEVFRCHGSTSTPGPVAIFDTIEQMESAGISPHYIQSSEISLHCLPLSEATLLTNLRTAMTAFAFAVASNAASQYMTKNNASAFRHGLGPSLKSAMVSAKLATDFDHAESCLRSYLTTVDTVSSSMVLNTSKPGRGDVLEQFILQGAENPSFTGQYGFVRDNGGFASLALSLTEETLKSILEATRHFKW